jgi:hypothetical protein
MNPGKKTPEKVMRACKTVLHETKRLQWVFAFLLIIMAYLFAETRYPALNYDDSYLLGHHFPIWSKKPFFGSGGYSLFWRYDSRHNQFRTYGLARVIHFGLYKLFGTDFRYYYWIMAAMASATALFAAFAAKSVTKSRATAIALACCCLLGPFALFQTFHHATYILLPLMATAAYLALHTAHPTGYRRQVLGGMMCVLITMTGEVATTILLTAIAILASCAAKTNDRAKLRNLLLEFSIIVVVLGILYGYYRLEIFNPDMADRFEVKKSVTCSSVIVALRGFNMMILDMLTCRNAIEVIKAGVYVDYSVTILILLSIITSIVAIVRSPEPTSGSSLRPALFLLMLYLASFIVYVAIPSWQGIGNYPPRDLYPPRYLHVSGFLLLSAGCLSAASVGSKIRKLFLVLLVCLSGAGGILTFGMKVPTVEATAEFLRTEIASAKAHGGTRVMFIAPPTAKGFINPYLMRPASSALTEWWILENYCPMVWGVSCTHGASGEPGDITINTTPPIRKGLMPSLTVEIAKRLQVSYR